MYREQGLNDMNSWLWPCIVIQTWIYIGGAETQFTEASAPERTDSVLWVIAVGQAIDSQVPQNTDVSYCLPGFVSLYCNVIVNVWMCIHQVLVKRCKRYCFGADCSLIHYWLSSSMKRPIGEIPSGCPWLRSWTWDCAVLEYVRPRVIITCLWLR